VVPSAAIDRQGYLGAHRQKVDITVVFWRNNFDQYDIVPQE
jgi:hypothetical protein